MRYLASIPELLVVLRARERSWHTPTPACFWLGDRKNIGVRSMTERGRGGIARDGRGKIPLLFCVVVLLLPAHAADTKSPHVLVAVHEPQMR